jgi:hypothetical protein
MSEIEKNKNEVMFLFGAGSSVPIGIPAMKGIYTLFLDRKISGISVSDKKTCEFFIKYMKIDEDLEEFLLAANTIIEFKDSKIKRLIENSISPIKDTSRIKSYNQRLNKKISEVKNVKKSILDFLSKICFKFDRERALIINRGFVKVVSSLDFPVYSTNYDYAFEYIAREEGIELNDNFMKKGQRYIWNDKICFSDDGGLRLIKLHGSVTWYIDHEGTIEKLDYSTKINTVGKEVEKIVIIPTRFKDIYAQNFFALYSHFLSSLNNAKVLIVVGHSLRDDYLRAGIIERKRKGNFQIIFIDPNYPQSVKKEMPPCKIGTVGDVIHVPYNWEQFSDELSNILSNSTPETIVKNCSNIINKDKRAKNKIKIKGNLGIFKTGEVKKISFFVSAYLWQHQKPARLRLWLRATQKDATGNIKTTVSASFIETTEFLLGDGLSGLVNTTRAIEVKVPKVIEWQDSGYKVELVVALVRVNVGKPVFVTSQNSFAAASKIIVYKL